MKSLAELPNLGIVLVEKLAQVDINTENDLREAGSENAIIRISTLEGGDACINMLYALEGAIQGIRWHGLSKERKKELKNFYKTVVEL